MSIRIRDLTKRYGPNAVVSGVTLEITDGDLFVLLGGSGSGKSTILRMIAGLITPDEGRIELGGQDVTDLPPQRRNTGFVFQNYSVFRHMTVTQNVEFGLMVRRSDRNRRRNRSQELLELVGLTGYGERFPSQLSGGQLQRVALARALAYDPAVLLLDEPFSALDVKIRVQLRQSLRAIQRELKVTTVLVTHDQEEAFELADQIGVLDGGLLVEVGAPEEVYHRPATEFAATFVGGGNVLVGRAEEGRIQLGGMSLPFPAGAPEHEPGAPVRILFRPETVRLREQPIAEGGSEIGLGPGEVIERTFAGSVERVLLGVEGLRGVRPLTPNLPYGLSQTPILSTALTTTSGAPVRVGDVLWIGVSGFHVLQPAGMKALVYSPDREMTDNLHRFSAVLARACAGPAALLRVTAPDEPPDRHLAELADFKQQQFADLPRIDTRVRKGNPLTELVREALEGDYEVILLTGYGAGSRMDPMYLCRDLGLPVALVPPSPEAAISDHIERVLICTAGGEPGKSDIRFGGRIARRARAAVTLFHVRPPVSSEHSRAWVDAHLERGSRMLQALGLQVGVEVSDGPEIVEAVLEAARRGAYDLVVIGAPAPRHAQRLYWANLASPIAEAIDRPLLIVPAVNGH